MGTHGDSVFLIVAWAVGSLLLSVVVAFSLLGAFLLIPLLPVVAIITVIVLTLKGKPAQTTLEEPVVVDTSVFEETEVMTPVPVAATVMEAEGECPLRRSFRVGETWRLNGKWVGSEICSPVERLLTKAAAQVRSGEAPDGELCQCLGNDHLVVFQVKKAEEEEVALPR